MHAPTDLWLVTVPAKPALIELYVYATDATGALLSATAEAPEAIAQHDLALGPIEATAYYRFDAGSSRRARNAVHRELRAHIDARKATIIGRP